MITEQGSGVSCGYGGRAERTINSAIRWQRSEKLSPSNLIGCVRHSCVYRPASWTGKRLLANEEAPGYRNNGTGALAGVGNEGSLWSGSVSGTNGVYLRFVMNAVQPGNANNRANGFQVRCLQAFISVPCFLFTNEPMDENTTEPQSQRTDTLLEDLFKAYFDARKHKRNTRNQLRFEMDLETNLIGLYNQIHSREYKVGPSVCFMVEHPVKREIFAADFRDRVVHHLLFNYIAPLFERTFITDSYSCLKNKGTLYGIERLEHHARSCSNNYKETCYVLKLDIQGYFMNINRRIMYETIERVMLKMGPRKSHKGKPWNELLDYDLIFYLLREVVFNDPTENCIMRGSRTKWADLPRSKSLFTSPKECGLPIGNLTSQLFSNIYLNDFDHFVKRKLGHKHYGRYVDDFYIIHKDKEVLKRHIREINAYLQENLGLTLHPKKIYLQEISKGVTFLGAVVKPYRRYMLNRTRNHFSALLASMNAYIRTHPKPSKTFLVYMQAAMNSYLGYMTHYKCYKMKLKMIPRMGEVLKLGYLTHDMTRYRLNREIQDRIGVGGGANVLPWEMECLPLPTNRAEEDFIPDQDDGWFDRHRLADEMDALFSDAEP